MRSACDPGLEGDARPLRQALRGGLPQLFVLGELCLVGRGLSAAIDSGSAPKKTLSRARSRNSVSSVVGSASQARNASRPLLVTR